MDESILKKLQGTELDLLLIFDEFCQKEQIPYFLEGGTALGAARHAGFIPWDDDVDVGMFRHDYEKLVSLKHRLPPHVSLDTPDEKPEMAPMFAKLCIKGTRFETEETREADYDQGIFLDIFIYDQLLKDEAKRKKQLRNASFWQSASYLYHSKHITGLPESAVGKAMRFACRMAHSVLKYLTNPRKIRSHFNRSLTMQGEKGNLYGTLAYVKTEPMPSDWFFPTQTTHFEGHGFPVPRNLDGYLQNLYGEWRKIPEKEERHVHSPLCILFPDGESWTPDSKDETGSKGHQ